MTARNSLFSSRLFWTLLISIFALAGGEISAQEKRSANQAAYLLRPMDVIRIEVFQEPDLVREVRVSQDYMIVVPLVGAVNVENRTLREAELIITERLAKDFIKNPQVNIIIAEYSPRVVNVLGAVNVPSSVSIPPERNFTLLDAVARAGGFSRLANRNRVILTTTRRDGAKENVVIDADQVVNGGAANRWIIQDGDVVYVPERML
ncbi:polysaccharide biosynthesis/export family protein [Oleiharenicola lentus]|uniref:polysaccharide biosynthesis/export family protein n=1 Tax=Oleiharenicola lentus TaxID=2508720 RepID=UPI003F67C9D0